MSRSRLLKSALVGSACAFVLASAAMAQTQVLDVPAGDLAQALDAYITQSGVQLVYRVDDVRGRNTKGVRGTMEPDQALGLLLAGTNLRAVRDSTGALAIAQEGGSGPQSAGADVDALIVTAQKREENIQDVPIAISAFSQEDLTRSQIAGGPDLITQVPNMTFTKTNFSSYSIQIRGIGTQAISATTDPAVSVAFNNTPFIRNHFFEQEFYDLQRVEVLRGPQGTLYGRNATAGVVNVISAKPKFVYEAKASADVSNYNSSRVEAMVNVPLVEDAVALRLAGAWTKREGFATNQISGNQIDGRDLWSTRLSLRVAPTDGIDVNMIWEHFEEDDDRLRSGKQLCTKDVVTDIAGFPVTFYQTLPESGQQMLFSGAQASFSQGCKRGSLYAPDAYQTPNGLMIPYYLPLGAVFLPVARDDPYESTVQSQDLRVIESTIDPDYRAKSDLGQIQVSFDLGGGLTLASETAYSTDFIYSLQDFNRFNTAVGAWTNPEPDGTLTTTGGGLERLGILQEGPNGGIFCDPQLGCSDRLVAVDIATARSRNFSQELRLSSDYDGPFNFSLGANFLRYDTEDKYYVFINSLTLSSTIVNFEHVNPMPDYVAGVSDNKECLRNGMVPADPGRAYSVVKCIYIDPNPIGQLNDRGHNYFLSRNPYKLTSYAAFGEVYYNISENLKVTAGLRWTADRKEAPRIPTWLLAGQSADLPVSEVVVQEWREPTGRLAIDWKPDLPFTDDTLLYASYARGYKAGGANPPTYVYAGYADLNSTQAASDLSATRPKTFDPEFVNAFEVGAKNTLADGRVTLNLAAFYYDYSAYQISEIVDRSAFNRNFDAEVWGLEIESDWRPLDNLRLGFKGGYQRTRIADGEKAIDLMDRTAGNPDWVVTRPFPSFASSCVLPAWLFVGNLGTGRTPTPENPELVNVGGKGGGNEGGCELAYYFGYDPATFEAYMPNPVASLNLRQDVDYPAWSTDVSRFPGWPTGQPITQRNYPGWDPTVDYGNNNGEGFFKDLGGNELPNAPHWTATVTADYTLPLANEWLMTLHSDVHWQSQSWWRVFNDDTFSKLRPYFTMNLAAIFTNEEAGWNIMAYIKNVTDETAITGAFLNSDDTGLTANVFLTEPRLYGMRVTKNFTGGPLLGSFGERRDGKGYPFTVELGGQIGRHDAPNEMYVPDFMAAFDPAIDLSGNQADDLDWGDGRSVKLTYAPSDGWKASLGFRFGEANQEGYEVRKGEDLFACNVTGPLCYPSNATVMNVFNDHGISEIREKEEHFVADFLVGRDVSFGSDRISSTLSAGLRYAKLKSYSNVSLSGTPDWDVPAEWFLFFNPAKHHEYEGAMRADRDFEGLGPMISWDASAALFEGEAFGRVGLDWSVAAGVLFGDQTASVSGGSYAAYWDNQMWADFPEPPTTEDPDPFDIAPRSKSVTVPTLDLSLGLSYKVDRFQMGAGYRWERYFDAIDGGIAGHESYDRTIDGPYFRVSVGFGG